MEHFPEYDLFWALLSIMLVISPEGKESPRLTMERVKANLIGALSAFAVIMLPFDIFYKIMIGIVAAALLCTIFKLLIVSRTAIVAIIIILIEKPEDGFMASIERFLSVLLGSMIGLVIVISTGYLIRFIHKTYLEAEFKGRE